MEQSFRLNGYQALSIQSSEALTKTAVSLLFALSIALAATSKSSAAELVQSKAGVAIRMALGEQRDPHFRKVVLANPLIDCIFVAAYWAELEEKEGKFDFSQLKQDIADWTATGKHAVIHINLYGQPVDDSITPWWLYEKKDVRAVHFSGGGVAKGDKVRIPAVWDPRFIDKHVQQLVKALAKTFDGDNRVWYIHPGFGHLGHITAQPSKRGGPALKKAGWTPEKWIDYCKRSTALYRSSFKKTPLLFSSSPKLLADRDHGGYAEQSLALCGQLAVPGDAVIFMGVTSDIQGMDEVAAEAIRFAPKAGTGIRFGMGDDWPLWVPEFRRGKGATYGADEKSFQASLNNCFQIGKTELPTTMLFLNPPEALASSSISPKGMSSKYKEYFYRKEIETILKSARERLLTNDRKLATNAGAGKSLETKNSADTRAKK